MTHHQIKTFFILAGISNILGVLVLSRGFTNETMMTAQPGVMGLFGLIMIVVWGLAYIAVATRYEKVRWLVGVFVVEKLAYVIAWLVFVTSSSLSALYEADLFAGVFFSIYGLNDLAFMLFFAHVFMRSRA